MGNNTPGQKFTKGCLRIGAAIVTLPTILAGLGVAIGGYFASLGLWVPGVISAAVAGIVSKDAAVGVSTFSAVTYCIAGLGMAIFGVGVAAGVYAAHGDTAFEEGASPTESNNPSSWVYR